MREIKFRVWSKTQSRMFQWGEILSMNLNNVFMGKQYSGLELQQFTGLHDKNGKEIYFGDKVLCTYGDNKGHIETINDINDFIEIYQCVNESGATLEVIGNIYENPGEEIE